MWDTITIIYRASSFGRDLPDYIGNGDHKVAIGGDTSLTLSMNDPTCQTFDHTIYRPKHGCEVNKDTLTVFCNFQSLRIDNSKIRMDQGGELLSSVMGRKESLEFPKYTRGAFTVSSKPNFNVPMEYRSGLHYLENVLNAMRYPSETKKKSLDMSCQETYPGTTLFITRYEYVNLYHTLTDWWNAFHVLPDNYMKQPHRVVFLDGHAQGGLDDV